MSICWKLVPNSAHAPQWWRLLAWILKMLSQPIFPDYIWRLFTRYSPWKSTKKHHLETNRAGSQQKIHHLEKNRAGSQHKKKHHHSEKNGGIFLSLDEFSIFFPYLQKKMGRKHRGNRRTSVRRYGGKPGPVVKLHFWDPRVCFCVVHMYIIYPPVH